MGWQHPVNCTLERQVCPASLLVLPSSLAFQVSCTQSAMGDSVSHSLTVDEAACMASDLYYSDALQIHGRFGSAEGQALWLGRGAQSCPCTGTAVHYDASISQRAG